MKYFISTIVLFIILLISSCEEEIIWSFDNQPSDLIVVEAVLTNERIPHVIKLSKPYQKQNLTPEAISGAIVIIKTDTDPQIYPATENPAGSGLYLTDSMRAVSGKLYTLTIQYNGKMYDAKATQPPVEAMVDTLSYSKVSEGVYTLDFYEFGKEPNYIKYTLDWQTADGCLVPKDCRAELIYYDLKNVDVIEQFKPDQERIDFPVGTMVIRKKYSVSDNYKAFLRGMLSETAWRGGPFDVYPANAPTNLRNGAVGFFAVSTVVSDTIVITP